MGKTVYELGIMSLRQRSVQAIYLDTIPFYQKGGIFNESVLSRRVLTSISIILVVPLVSA